MKKFFVIAFAAASCALATGSAQARNNVYWSIGINAPPIGTVVSNVPVYQPAPVYYAPVPVYYEPAPVYYEPAPVYVRPPRVIYRPQHVVYGGRYWDARAHHWRHHHHHHHRGWHQRDWRRDEYGSHRGWQRDQRRYRHD